MAQHAIVVGAGIVGLNAAYALRREGFAVSVIDPEPPGMGASFGNAGILARGAVVPVPMPGVLWRLPGMLFARDAPVAVRWRHLPGLAPWLARFVLNCRPARAAAASKALAALLAPTDELYAPIIDDLGATDLVRRTGMLYAYGSEAGFRAGAPEREMRRARGIEMVELDGAALRQMAPALAREIEYGFLLPDVAHVTSPIALSQAYAAWLGDRGATFIAERATGYLFEKGRVRGIKTTRGAHRGDVVVLAAGAYSKPLAAALGCRIPLDSERGYHVTVAEPGIDLRLPVTSVEGAFVATPMRDGLRLAGTDELASVEASPDYRRADAILRRARRLFPALGGRVASRWMGRRPSLPDSLPVIGRAPGHDNVVFAFGHGHLGLTLGAVTGRLVADLAAGRAPSIELTPFRPERF